MRVLCLGINHKTADVAVREKLVFDAGAGRAALRQLAGTWLGAEFLILSTCNRTEVYTARPLHGHPRDHELRAWLAQFRGVSEAEFGRSLYTLEDAEAMRHLFAVAAGMDSLVPGEDQIVAQLKQAYALAVEAGAAGAVLNEVVQTAFHAAKHVRTETGIASGKVSVASVAIEFVSRIFETLAGKCVLNVGAGKMNELMLRQLVRRGCTDVLVTNRSFDRARRLAEACGAQAVPFNDLADHVARADVVLTSTASEAAILSRRMIERAQARRRWRPLLIVDIAVPRDVEPQAGELDNVFLYNIDDLDRVVRTTIERRHGEREAAEAILAEHLGELTDRLSVRDVAPTIEALYRTMQRIADEELRSARNKLAQHDDTEADMEILRRTLHRTIRRILHPCTARLRESAATGAAANRIAALRELFDLDAEGGGGRQRSRDSDEKDSGQDKQGDH